MKTILIWLLIRKTLIRLHNCSCGKCGWLHAFILYLIYEIFADIRHLLVDISITGFGVAHVLRLYSLCKLLSILLSSIRFNLILVTSLLHYLINHIQNTNVQIRFLLDLFDTQVVL